MSLLSRRYTNFLVLGITIIVCVLGVYNFIQAQTWTAPTATPPAGNASAPINVSATAQTKAGDLAVANLTSGNVINAANYVWAPTLNTNTLNANVSTNAPTTNTTNVWASNLLYGPYIQSGDIYSWWRVRSNAYCDQGGGNCIAPWNIQPKVWGTCPAGEAIAQVYGDGNVRCQPAGGGGGSCSWSDWVGRKHYSTHQPSSGYNSHGAEIYCPNNGEIAAVDTYDNNGLGAMRALCCTNKPVTPPTYAWKTTGWGYCSVPLGSCTGRGKKTRYASCVNTTYGGFTEDMALCGGGRPASSQSCSGYIPAGCR